MIEIVNTGKGSAFENMSIDADLLTSMHPDDAPILHLYEWEKPSLTYGYFIKPQDHLNLDELAEHGIDMARRPTGGGIVFHIWDLAFSLLIPANHSGYHENPLDNYTYVARFVQDAMQNLLGDQLALLPDEPPTIEQESKHFCYAKATRYDVILKGRKIAGAAQRKKRNGFLHQGSISLVKPDFDLLKNLLKTDLTNMMDALTYYVPEGDLSLLRSNLCKALVNSTSMC